MEKLTFTFLKVVDKTKKFKTKEGKERPSVTYFAVADNGQRIAVKPLYSDGYTKLDFCCEVKFKE